MKTKRVLLTLACFSFLSGGLALAQTPAPQKSRASTKEAVEKIKSGAK